jgi:hypothetical protein
MKVGKLCFKCYDSMAIAGDVPSASGTGAHAARGLDHGVDNQRMTSHSKVVVGAPYHDFAAVAAITPACVEWPGGMSLEIREDTITALSANAVEIRMKMTAQCHGIYSLGGWDVIRIDGRTAVLQVTSFSVGCIIRRIW